MGRYIRTQVYFQPYIQRVIQLKHHFPDNNKAASSSSATVEGGAELDTHLAELNAANYARANTRATTNQSNPPNAIFSLYDPDDDDFLAKQEMMVESQQMYQMQEIITSN